MRLRLLRCHADTANDLSSSSSKFENQRDKEEEEDKYGCMNSAIWFPLPYMQRAKSTNVTLKPRRLEWQFPFTVPPRPRARRRHRILAEGG